jgi:hypothetical protein
MAKSELPSTSENSTEKSATLPTPVAAHLDKENSSVKKGRNAAESPTTSLRRDEMDCLKAAMAVVVLKRRIQASKVHGSSSQSKKPNTTLRGALAAMTGDALVRPQRKVVQFSTEHKQLPVDTEHWKAHLEHILQLAVQKVKVEAAAQHWNGLCVHAACQLEQLMAKNAEKSVVADWMHGHFTAFQILPSLLKNKCLCSNEVAWLTVWQCIVQAKPNSMTELLIPVVLDLLLKQHYATNNTNLVDGPIRMGAARLLCLLEDALDVAQPHVLSIALDTLLPSDNAATSPLLPATNSSWYSIADVAHDYQQRDGEYLLLGHGLAYLSERLLSTLNVNRNNDGATVMTTTTKH